MSYPINTNVTSNPVLRNNHFPSCPISPTSPLSLPPLMPDSSDGDHSPSPSIGFLTPHHSPPSNPRIIDGTSHTVLHSLASAPSPDPNAKFDFPLLPAHHPLRKHHLTSPPHSPKGHPVRPIYNRSKSHVISNPYAHHSYATTAGHLMRVPRRLRPVLFFVLCFCILGITFLSRALSKASELDMMIAQRKALALERRIVHVDGLMDINAPGQKVEVVDVVAHEPEQAIQVQYHEPSHGSFRFETEKDELIALINFITATAANSLPPLDPSLPLDPSAVLDFDPSHSNAYSDFELLKAETNTLYPVVLFGKMRDPWHREVQKVLAEYRITPAPLVVDVDQRNDHLLFIPLLARILKTEELPQMLLLGTSLGSYHDILSLRDSGKLRETLEASGHVSIRDIKKKKKGVKERERLENERILGPKPIVDGE